MKLTGEALDAAVLAAGQGDREALAAVLESVQEPLLRYCRGRLGVGERHLFSADDVAQEALMAVMTALPRYRDEGRPFLAFAYGIASRKVADAMRVVGRTKADPTDELPERPNHADDPERYAVQAESNRAMSALLDTLSAKQREILVLRLIVGLSADETANAVGSTPGAVRVAQHRALAKLRGQLQNQRDRKEQRR